MRADGRREDAQYSVGWFAVIFHLLDRGAADDKVGSVGDDLELVLATHRSIWPPYHPVIALIPTERRGHQGILAAGALRDG